MNTITARIDSIIAARKTSLENLITASVTLEECSKTVKSFDQLQKIVTSDPAYLKLFGKPEIEQIKKISTASFHSVEQNYKASLAHLTERFKRKKLHISFIGHAGHGKSLVMQNISGLGSDVIPSAGDKDCTGANSIITNNPNAEPNTATAEITFYSQAEIIDKVNKYLETLFGDKRKVDSIDAIKELAIDEMRKELPEGDVFNKLEKYVKKIGEYERFLGTTREVSKQDIEKYVAQYKHNEPSTEYFTYLGVKLANITCKFPADVGNIVLVDTIGIGDFALDTETKMLDTVKNDSDVIVFVLRPDKMDRARLGEKEGKFIKKISKEISYEYASEMLFLLLNLVKDAKGEYTKTTEIHKNAREYGYSLAAVLDVDCYKADEVKTRLIEPILKQLAERGSEIDKLLINRLNELGKKLYEQYSAIINALDKISVDAANEDIRRKLSKKIEDTYRTKVLNALRDLKGLDNPRQKWEEACEPSLDYIRQAVPTEGKIRSLLNDGTIKPFNVVDFCTESMRVRIINHFLKLDTDLQGLINQTKMKIIHILADDDKGLLGKVYPVADYTPEKWIDGFMEKTKCNQTYPLLAEALTTLKNFTINVQGFLIYKIYRNLDNVNISSSSRMPKIFAGLNKKDETDEKTSADTNKKDELFKEINSSLKDYANQVYSEINKIMSESYSVPNETIFAAIKTFYDQATYAGRDETLSVTTEWRYLYEDWISVIWSEEYKAHSLLRDLAQKWNNMVAQLKKYNKEETFAVR